MIVMLIDKAIQLATISLSTAHVGVSLGNGGLVVDARLGNMQVVDDSALETVSSDFKHLLSIPELLPFSNVSTPVLLHLKSLSWL